jgi:nucleoside-diphosphate-sugar epimerase
MGSNDKLLIIGGTGFIGSLLTKEALNRGFNVTVLSLSSKKVNSNIKHVNYLFANISNIEELSKVLKNNFFHHVVNLGGYINHSNFSIGGSKIFDSHFLGLYNLIKCVNRRHLKSFVQIGSSDEYGSNVAPQKESQRELPISPYSSAKTSATYLLQMLNRTEEFPVVILRPFLVYGPGQDKNRFIPQVINGCLSKNEFPVSQGEQLRDFCYISDFISAIISSFENYHAFGEVINIGSGRPIAIKEVINIIKNIIGFGNPKFGEIPYRVEENMALYADITKANRLLNWSPKITLKDGLEKTIKFHKDFLL